jgi:DNA polymerase alpha subunit B
VPHFFGRPLYAPARFDAFPQSTFETKLKLSITEIKERFAPAGTEIEADVLAELQSIMRLHSIDVQELWYKWESYSMKMGADDMKLNIETARALKQDIQDGLERDNRSKAHLLSTSKRGGATPRNVASNGDVFGM